MTKQNAEQKPTFDQVTTSSSIRAKVEDYLLKSKALETYWHRPIAKEQRQGEIDRMARQTEQPAMLKELWAALGNGPSMIAECLARPALVNRLIRNWYASDVRFHGALKARAEAELQAYGTPGQMRRMTESTESCRW